MGRDLIGQANTLYEQTLGWLADKEKVMINAKREAEDAQKALKVEIVKHLSGKMNKS